MRGSYVPFTEENDVTATPTPFKTPLANASGQIDPGWVVLTPPTGGATLIGIISSPLPNLASNVRAIGYDPSADQTYLWQGTRWILRSG